LSKFIIHTLETETISQYKIQGKQLMKEIISFAKKFEQTPTGFSSKADEGNQYKPLDADDDVLDSDDEEIEDIVRFTIIDKINELLQISNEEYKDKKV